VALILTKSVYPIVVYISPHIFLHSLLHNPYRLYTIYTFVS
jgi:hypothetical protein